MLERPVPAVRQNVLGHLDQEFLPRGSGRRKAEAGRQGYPVLPPAHQRPDPYENLPRDVVCPDRRPARPEVRFAVRPQHRNAPAEGKSDRIGRTGKLPEKDAGRFSEEGINLILSFNSFINNPIQLILFTISALKNRAEIVFFSPEKRSTFAIVKRKEFKEK